MRRVSVALTAMLVLTGCAQKPAGTTVERPQSAPSPVASATSNARSGLLDAINVVCVLPAASAATNVERALTTRLTPAGSTRDGGTYGKYRTLTTSSR